jgi:hypothetical protein
LKLNYMPVAHSDLGSISACSHLSSLQLLYCQVEQMGTSNTLSPLSALCSLKQLSLWDTDSSIAAGLAQLTGLSVVSEHRTSGLCLEHIDGLTQLQHLHLGGPRGGIAAEQLADIFITCQQLTSLALCYSIQQPEFDALLTHGTQLTLFTCHRLNLEEDRSAWPCSWQELVIEHQELDAETLAYIPTASLTHLVFGYSVVFPSPCPTLEFRFWGTLDPGNMPEIVRRSLVNLMRCPAWQQCGPAVHVVVFGHPELGQVLGSLGPLVSKEVQLPICTPGVPTGASEVQQLGGALGSSLKHLVLQVCEVSDGFWPAVWDHLPGLQQLTVEDRVGGAVGAHELSVFCGRAARPLQLNLEGDLYREVEGRLDQEGRWMGAPQVTVTEVWP